MFNTRYVSFVCLVLRDSHVNVQTRVLYLLISKHTSFDTHTDVLELGLMCDQIGYT